MGGLAALVRDAKQIVAVIGAGVSVSCGIPDFRSEHGIYSMVREMGLELDQPEMLFDLETFKDDPAPFFAFAHHLFPGSREPSPTHRFLRLLELKGKLRRVYTQNIDALEAAAGQCVRAGGWRGPVAELPHPLASHLRPSRRLRTDDGPSARAALTGLVKVVSCHGSLAHAACLRCRKKVPAAAIAADVAARRVPHCQREGCGGVMKPTVTFFGEKLGNRVTKALEVDWSELGCSSRSAAPLARTRIRRQKQTS